MSSQLPIELMIEILVRLPAKSLLRFTIVCKLWFSIITTPNFITTHLKRLSDSNTAQLLLRTAWSYDDNAESYLLLPDNKMINETHTKLGYPFGGLTKNYGVVGSCNGLVCLRSNLNPYRKFLIISNPSIRKWVTIELKEQIDLSVSVIGFGFASEKREYKLVNITYGKCFQDQGHLNWSRVPLSVDVYEQGREKWRAIGCAPPPYCDGYMNSQVFINGAVHWLALNAAESNNMIAVFDMGDEVFREIALPPNLLKHNRKCLSVDFYKGSLGILYVRKLGSKECSLWVMRIYGVSESWTNLYNIILPDCLYKTLGFRKSGEILFLTQRAEVVSYDPETRTVTIIVIQGISVFWTCHRIHNYTESLVFLTDENLKGRKQGFTRIMTRLLDTRSNDDSKKIAKNHG